MLTLAGMLLKQHTATQEPRMQQQLLDRGVKLLDQIIALRPDSYLATMAKQMAQPYREQVQQSVRESR